DGLDSAGEPGRDRLATVHYDASIRPAHEVAGWWTDDIELAQRPLERGRAELHVADRRPGASPRQPPARDDLDDGPGGRRVSDCEAATDDPHRCARGNHG